eukprot:g10276.t1
MFVEHHQQLHGVVFALAERLQSRNITFNVTVFPGATRATIAAREFYTAQSFDPKAMAVASLESLGHWIIVDEDNYNNIADAEGKNLDALLDSLSIPEDVLREVMDEAFGNVAAPAELVVVQQPPDARTGKRNAHDSKFVQLRVFILSNLIQIKNCRDQDLIAGPEAEALKVARTKRLIALNIVDTTVDWAELKDYIKVTLGRAPTFVKINHGVDKNWAIIEFSTLADARLAIDTLNGRPFRLGAPLYLRQDREDRSLNAACGGCCAPRNNSCVGEWFGMDWYCTRCTIPEDLHSLPVIDCHAHLDFVMDGRTGDEISDSEIRTAVFDDLALQGRFAVITSCCDLAAIENTIRLVRLGAGHVFAAFGAHPKRALHEWDADLKWLFKDAIRRCNWDPATGSYVRRVVAWGECGLDYSGYVGGDAREEPAVGGAAGLTTQSDGALVKKSINLQYQQISNKSIALLAPVEVFDANQIRMEIARQKEILRENIDVAIELRLPIQFHSRDCEADFIDCLLQWLPRDHPFHWHSAIASLPAVEKILRHFPHGYFGVSGYLCFPYAEEWELPNQMQSETNHGNPMPTPNTVNLFDMVRRIPLERIVLETDSPHFTVRSGGPADVLEIAQALAEVKGGGLSAEKRLVAEWG